MFWRATDRASRWNCPKSKSDWKRPRYERTKRTSILPSGQPWRDGTARRARCGGRRRLGVRRRRLLRRRALRHRARHSERPTHPIRVPFSPIQEIVDASLSLSLSSHHAGLEIPQSPVWETISSARTRVRDVSVWFLLGPCLRNRHETGLRDRSRPFFSKRNESSFLQTRLSAWRSPRARSATRRATRSATAAYGTTVENSVGVRDWLRRCRAKTIESASRKPRTVRFV